MATWNIRRLTGKEVELGEFEKTGINILALCEIKQKRQDTGTGERASAYMEWSKTGPERGSRCGMLNSHGVSTKHAKVGRNIRNIKTQVEIKIKETITMVIVHGPNENACKQIKVHSGKSCWKPKTAEKNYM